MRGPTETSKARKRHNTRRTHTSTRRKNFPPRPRGRRADLLSQTKVGAGEQSHERGQCRRLRRDRLGERGGSDVGQGAQGLGAKLGAVCQPNSMGGDTGGGAKANERQVETHTSRKRSF